MSVTVHEICAGLEPRKLRVSTEATLQAIVEMRMAVRFFEERTRSIEGDHRLARGVMACFLLEEIERLGTMVQVLTKRGESASDTDALQNLPGGQPPVRPGLCPKDIHRRTGSMT